MGKGPKMQRDKGAKAKKDKKPAPQAKFERGFIARILKYAAHGATNKEMAEYLGVTEQTFYNWIKEYPEFARALEEVDRSRAAGEVEKAYFKQALPHDEVVEIHELKGRGKRAKMKLVGKRIAKNVVSKKAAKDILQAYKSDRYSEKLQIPGGVNLKINIKPLRKNSADSGADTKRS